MFNKVSIHTKFILIISLLLAGILSLQFYFTNRVHQDIIREIEQITRSFNQATDAYFFGDNDSLFFRQVPDVEALQERVKVDLKELEHLEENIFEFRVHKEFPDPEEIEVEIFTNGETELLDKFRSTDFDSLKERMSRLKEEVIAIRKPVKRNTIEWKRKGERLVKPSDSHYSFSFIIPDLSAPKAPKLLEYQYNAEELNQVIRKMRNRNAIITLLLFGVSIIAVTLIARRFVKPIRSLNASFDRVVQGDLTVAVDAKSNDEIGELTRSFNTMVRELRKNREKENLIRRKERLASLGQLAAGVAHEVRNPLNAINLTIEHLRDKFVDTGDGQASTYVETIQGEIKRLDKTVNNFLNYIRSEQLDKKPFDVRELLEEILNLYERELVTSGIKLKTSVEPAFVLTADRERFKTALVNILVNAVQAMPDSGVLTVETRKDAGEIRISDTGGGIPEKNLDLIFDLFYTTKSTGTGLGLPTAYKIIKEHGGEITIKSEENRGTEVIITMT